MRIDVIGRDVKITDDLRQHAERKGEKLPKYFDRTQLITSPSSRRTA
jgi:ribosome-associated translation inhibitor RaiA